MGCFNEVMRAGHKPKRIPVTAEKPQANKMEAKEIPSVQPVTCVAIKVEVLLDAGRVVFRQNRTLK